MRGTMVMAALVALAAGLTRAEEPGQAKKKADDAPKAEGKAKEAPAPAAAAADALTHEGLKKRLEDMGFDFKETKSTSGTTMYLVTVDRNDYRYVFYVSLSSDLKRLWVSAALRALPEPGKVRADVLEKILAKNYELGPTYFSVKSNRTLYLELPLANRGLTPRTLRNELDEFMAAIRSTQPLWDPAKYPPLTAGAKDTPKEKAKEGKAKEGKDGK